jgi:2-polyprenyl-3-methyl-5-hydroxy-6-metoxy-1,4-benzoquinol methylase
MVSKIKLLTGKDMTLLQRGLRFIKFRIKDLPPVWKFIDPRQRWLYKHRYLRMDANETINDQARREFHKDRYLFARDTLKKAGLSNARVLDSACGTGYGSAILKEVVSEVQGVDISQDAVDYANQKYGSSSICFKQADVTQMKSLGEGSFDAAVSFETIEHISEPLKFLENLHGLLKNNGIVIISTPNKWGPTRDHHFDYDYPLFRKHLEKFFTIENMYVQNSGCMDLWVNRGAPRRLVPVTQDNIDQAECFLAVCRKQ